MKQPLTLLLSISLPFFLCYSAFGQCNPNTCTTPVPAINAQDACILPNAQALNCYYGATTPDLPQSFPPSWCTDIDNNHWFAFTATSSVAVFIFNVFNCTFGHSIQVGVFSTVDCITFQTIRPCTTISDVGTSYTILTSGLTVGNVYYLCIDGTDGALCEYSINATNPGINAQGNPNVCLGNNVTSNFNANGPSTWSIQPPGAGMFVGNSTGAHVTVQWLQAGPAQVCAQNTDCPTAPLKCYDVLIGGGESEEHVNLCEGKSVSCGGQTYTTPGVYEVHFNNGQNCDSIARCIVHLIPTDTTTEEHSVCQGDSVLCAGKYFSSPGMFPLTLQTPQGCDSIVRCQINIIPVSNAPLSVVTLCGPASYQVCDSVYNMSGVYGTICTGSQGCDSIVNVDLAILDPQALIAPPDTLGCAPGATVLLSANGSSQNNASGGTTTYEWTGPGIVGPTNQSTAEVNQPGTYCLVLTHGRGTLSCSDTTCVTVADSGAVALPPFISGNQTPCSATTVIYTAAANGLPLPLSFTWTLPGNVPFTQISPDSISVTWPDTMVSGQICVTADNLCGSSQATCLSVTLQIAVEQPVLSGPAVVCADGGDYIYTLNIEQPGVTYIWSVPTGAVLTGSGDTVQVNFLNSASGQVCVVAQNACGIGTPVCQAVSVSPIPTADLSADAEICAGDSIDLHFALSGNGPFDVIWSEGKLNDIANGHVVKVSPAATHVYKLISVNDNSVPACSVALQDSVKITVWQHVNQTVSASICEGETYTAGGAVQSVSGVYTDSLQTIHGCDSIIVTILTVNEIDTLVITNASCDPSQVGTFTETFTQANGCDSIVIRTTTLLRTDTILLSDKNCDINNVGVFTQELTNIFGCDSTVITTVSFSLSDTTLISGSSCNPADTGVFYTPLLSADGCDSLIITTITLLPKDSTFITGTSCDPQQAGVFITTLTNVNGCDSVLIRTISLLPTDSTFLQTTTCDASQAGVFVYILQNTFGCDSIVSETRTLLPSGSTTIQLTTCDPALAGTETQVYTNQWGCDSSILIITTLLPANECALSATLVGSNVSCSGALTITVTSGIGPFEYTLLLEGNPFSNGTVASTNVPQLIGGLLPGNYTVNISSANGLTTSVQAVIQPFSPPSVGVVASSDYNGFALSCHAAADGSAAAVTSGGIAPYQFEWSNGGPAANIAGLAAGVYTVTVTDANGCSASASLTLTEPSALAFTFTVNNLNCFGAHNGAIQIETQGGVPPYRYAIDNQAFQVSNLFSDLDAGAHTVTVLDANDCERNEIILIDAALPVQVDLGQDQTIVLGGTTVLQAVVNVPIDSILSIAWTPPYDSAECNLCLMQVVAPFVSTTYSVTVTTLNGCSGEDQVTVIVDRRKDIYIPNVFSPNDDLENDKFGIYVKAGVVKRVRFFRVFDRWGEQVYSMENFAPDPEIGWDGRFQGVLMNPAVFVWAAELEFADGSTELFKGDVTLMR